MTSALLPNNGATALANRFAARPEAAHKLDSTSTPSTASKSRISRACGGTWCKVGW